jgi:HAD superfamily hydrolase (TIGR01509 family)
VVLLLDIDGTLVDTNYLHVDAWARAFHAIGLVVPRAAIHRQIGKGSDQFLPEFVKDPKAAERADGLHLEEYARLAQFGFALPGARELLQTLRADGHPMWVATSAKPEELAQRLDTLGVRGEILAGVVSSGDVERSKPAPDVFVEACRRAHCKPEQALVIGDTVWDMLAAKAAGTRAVAVLTGGAFSREELRAAGALAVYEDCAEMVARGFPRELG